MQGESSRHSAADTSAGGPGGGGVAVSAPSAAKAVRSAALAGAMAERTGSTVDAAEQQLDQYAVDIAGNSNEVILSVADHILVRASRTWLADLDGEK